MSRDTIGTQTRAGQRWDGIQWVSDQPATLPPPPPLPPASAPANSRNWQNTTGFWLGVLSFVAVWFVILLGWLIALPALGLSIAGVVSSRQQLASNGGFGIAGICLSALTVVLGAVAFVWLVNTL